MMKLISGMTLDVRHRIDGLEIVSANDFYAERVRHRIDGLESIPFS